MFRTQIYRVSFVAVLCGSLLACGGGSTDPTEATADDANPLTQLPQTQMINDRIKADPNNPELYFSRGSLLLNMNDANAASKDFIQAIKLDSTKAQYYLAAAETFYNVQRVPQAILLLERAERNAPPDPRVQLELGKAYYTIAQYDKAAQKLDPLLVQQPNNAPTHFWKGMLLKDLQKIPDAIAELKKATELDPQYYNAHMMLAQLYAQANNPATVATYDAAAAIDTTQTEALYAKALYLQNKGNTAQAIAAYQQLIERNPQNQDAFYNLGYIYYQKKDIDKALQHFELATKMNPVFAKAYYMMGQCQVSKGDKKAATVNFNKAITFDPELTDAQQALDKLK